MLKKGSDLKREVIQCLKGGKGEVELIHLLEVDKNEFNGKGRLFARNTLKPGASIGFHKHEGDAETYYILSGEGTVNDNGTIKVVQAGDLVYTPHGESHSLENTGTTDLEFIALILFN
ncbi:MAG: cupin [Clostridiaceae bacterium BRH_c20a]|nr:MAG: cupin [Clostridiaceae bacterium BRH_c20a]